MDNEGLQRLQEIAAKAAQSMSKVGQAVATGLPTPPELPVLTQHPSDTAPNVIPFNRAQRRKGKASTGTRKRSHRDPEVHAYAERIRHMTDQQIWDWGHDGRA